jgi:hypothetical protein
MNTIMRTSKTRELLTAAFLLFGSLACAEQKALTGTVKLTSTVDGLPRSGSGVIVCLGDMGVVYILTASHVVAGDPAPRVEFHGGKFPKVNATVLGSEPGDAGLAFLKTQLPSETPTPFIDLRTTATLTKGSVVTVVGMTMFAGDWTLVEGKIANTKENMLVVSAEVDEGNSGGPVFLGESEKIGNPDLLGIVVATQGKFAQVITAEHARKFIDSLNPPFGRIPWRLNHNSMVVREAPGLWRYFYNGTLNADQIKIRIDQEGVLHVDLADASYSGPIYDASMPGNTLLFRRGAGRAELRFVNHSMFEGRFTDDRGTVPFRLERVAEAGKDDLGPPVVGLR